jgi:hypothetical protein
VRFLVALPAALAFGAPRQSPEIRGAVLRPGSNQPVVDRGVAGGKKVEVGPNGFQNVAMEVTETATQA